MNSIVRMTKMMKLIMRRIMDMMAPLIMRRIMDMMAPYMISILKIMRMIMMKIKTSKKKIMKIINLLNPISEKRLSICLKQSLKKYQLNAWHNGKN
jgi:hypothetical protein